MERKVFDNLPLITMDVLAKSFTPSDVKE